MTAPRASGRYALVAFLAAVPAPLGCGGGGAPMTTAVEIPSAPRHPDGVMLDPSPAIPSAKERAPARGIVALRPVVGEEEAILVVKDFVHAFEREDKEALSALLAERATQLDAHGAGNAEALRAFWEARLRSFDYTKLAGTEIFRPEQVERYAYDELGGPGVRRRPGEMRPGDLLLRVPILTPRVGADRLFGDVVVLLVRREEGRLKIAGYGEDEAR